MTNNARVIAEQTKLFLPASVLLENVYMLYFNVTKHGAAVLIKKKNIIQISFQNSM